MVRLLFGLLLLLSAGGLYSFFNAVAALKTDEIKARSARHDKRAAAIYPLLARMQEFHISVLLLQSVLVALGIQAFYTAAGGWAIAWIAILFTVFRFLPQSFFWRHGEAIAARLAPAFLLIMKVLRPVAQPLARFVERRLTAQPHQVYSRAQLMRLLATYQIPAEAEIAEDELEIVKHVLQFGDRKIESVMTPQRAVVAVAADEPVGPVLLDRLHKSGFSRFPVYERKTDEIVGTLFLRDLLHVKDVKLVEQVMDKRVYYVSSQAPLDHALQAFLKTGYHLFIVIDEFQEIRGVISIEDVLEQILGRTIVDEFDQYDDMRAVAALEAIKLKRKRQIIK